MPWSWLRIAFRSLRSRRARIKSKHAFVALRIRLVIPILFVNTLFLLYMRFLGEVTFRTAVGRDISLGISMAESSAVRHLSSREVRCKDL